MKRELEDLKAVNRRVVATLVRLEGKIDGMSERMATKDDLAALRNGICGKLDLLIAKLKEIR